MKSIPIYQVDAFSKKVFSGNPAAVCILDNWLSDGVMQAIASENNLSETAFINMNTKPFGIRWFTPECEMGLCGHATLASARVLFDEYMDRDQKEITFSAQRGLLKTIKKSEQIFLDFPADEPMEQDINKGIQKVERKKFIMKCSKPNCRGFLSDDWKCGTCDSITCKKCHTVVEENHVCKKEDIDTFIFHQASAVVLNKLKKKLDILDLQWFNQIENIGNTVSATIPIAISILQNENKFSYSKKYLLMGFGVGLSVAGCIIS